MSKKQKQKQKHVNKKHKTNTRNWWDDSPKLPNLVRQFTKWHRIWWDDSPNPLPSLPGMDVVTQLTKSHQRDPRFGEPTHQIPLPPCGEATHSVSCLTKSGRLFGLFGEFPHQKATCKNQKQTNKSNYKSKTHLKNQKQRKKNRKKTKKKIKKTKKVKKKRKKQKKTWKKN